MPAVFSPQVSAYISIALALLAIGCAWSVSLSTSIFLSDGATQKSVRRGIMRIGLFASATFVAAFDIQGVAMALFFVAAAIHLADMKANRSRWMSGRMSPVTAAFMTSMAVAMAWFLGQEPLFFAVLTLASATRHILKMRLRQQEFFQNFQLLRDRMATLDAQKNELKIVPPQVSRDNQPKAG